MIYRVVLKISYYENWFDFDNVEDAGRFAETVLMHQTVSEDRKVLRSEVIMKIVDPTKANNDDED